MPDLTESEIAKFLYYRYQSSHEILVPNFHVPGWSEADLFGITKWGYSTEFEIKRSVQDYKADAKKTVWVKDRRANIKKHELLAESSGMPLFDAGKVRGPKRFYFVVPTDLIQLPEVPNWAGLIYCDYRGRLDVVRQAPSRHSNKATEFTKKKAYASCYYRMWRMINAQ